MHARESKGELSASDLTNLYQNIEHPLCMHTYHQGEEKIKKRYLQLAIGNRVYEVIYSSIAVFHLMW